MGYQLFVWHSGCVAASMALGYSAPSRPCSVSDIGRLYCAAKPLTAACFARAVQAGAVAFDHRVSRYLPQFTAGPRRDITFRQLLSHTSGLPNFDYYDPYAGDARYVVERACAAEIPAIDWHVEPIYNNTYAWYILAAALERIYTLGIADIIETEISKPLGLGDLGMKHPDPKRYAVSYRKSEGSFRPVPAPPPEVLYRSVNPAHGGFSTTHDLGLFYAELIRSYRGTGKLLTPALAHELTRCHGCVDLGWGLGERGYGLGFFTDVGRDTMGGGWSRVSFGHGGLLGRQMIIYAFADIGRDVAVAIRFFSLGPKNSWRFRKLGSAIYSDLGLGPRSGGQERRPTRRQPARPTPV